MSLARDLQDNEFVQPVTLVVKVFVGFGLAIRLYLPSFTANLLHAPRLLDAWDRPEFLRAVFFGALASVGSATLVGA